MSNKKFGEGAISLGRGGERIMSWSSSLNIYRVNRFHGLPLTDPNEKFKIEERFDFVESLLDRNLTHIVEDIFEYVGFESTWRCLRVCHLWYDFIASHIFKRWADRMLKSDSALEDFSSGQVWRRRVDLALSEDDVTSENTSTNHLIACGRICRQIHELREVWCNQEPKMCRYRCDSFVLSLRFDDADLFCGLNNGSIQLWDLNFNILKREQESHDKGVKSMDVSKDYIVSGSYDCTCKIWSRSTWSCLHVIRTHADSVWDLRLHDRVLVTAGLDGIVGIFHILGTELQTTRLMQVQNDDDMVAAVDFNNEILITGSEDSSLAIWNMSSFNRMDILNGHNGGITGIQLTGNIFVSSSYDGTVRLWSDVQNKHLFVCLHQFKEPSSLLRCVGFNGSVIASGDFSGNIHFWNVEIQRNAVKIKKYRKLTSHKSHVVCIQLNPQRMVSGSRDKTVLVQDFWAKVPKLKIF